MNARTALDEVHALDRGAQPVGGALDERRVERAGDAQLDRAPRALTLGLDAASSTDGVSPEMTSWPGQL